MTMESMQTEKNHAGEAHVAGDPQQHAAHSRLLDELQAFKLDRYEEKPEYRKEEASKSLIPLEHWLSDEKLCGVVSQDKLENKLADFANKTDDMWKHKEEKDLDAVSRDQWLTIPRFDSMFSQLDDQHRDKLLETLPWSLQSRE